MNRRHILIAGIAVAGVAVAGGLAVGWRTVEAEDAAGPGEDGLFPDDRILGDPNAPITIIEYSSLTCPHCASFHEGTLPQIKAKWIEEGRARLVFRHFPFDRLGLFAALAANCLDGDQHFAFIDVLFRSQARWTRAEDPVEALAQLAALAGVDRARFDACVSDEKEYNAIQTRRNDARDRLGITSTPSFIINGRKFVGDQGFEKFEQALIAADSRS